MYTEVDEARLNSQAWACEQMAKKIKQQQDTLQIALNSVKSTWTGEAASLWESKLSACQNAASDAINTLYAVSGELRNFTATHHTLIETAVEEITSGG